MSWRRYASEERIWGRPPRVSPSRETVSYTHLDVYKRQVFIALICLIIIIVLLGKIMTAVTGNKASQTTPAQAPAPAPAAPAAVPAPAAQPGNQQLVAAIAAAIAEDMGEDVYHIKILSIRRV